MNRITYKIMVWVTNTLEDPLFWACVSMIAFFSIVSGSSNITGR